VPPRTQALAVTVVATLIALSPGARSQPPRDDRPSPAVTMEELHRSGGVPRGWRFKLPAGDAARGRRVFADLECYKCHAVAGADFPTAAADPKNAGPELTGMGAYHPAEYFAESVLSPNAVIVKGPGYTSPDGRSIMPGYAESLSVTQLIDLVAYLRSLTAGDPHGGAMQGHEAHH